MDFQVPCTYPDPKRKKYSGGEESKDLQLLFLFLPLGTLASC